MEDLSIYNPEGSILRQAQLRMLHILQEFDQICRRNHIAYWLDSGTLLGAVRHGGFIPWDDDIDVAILRKDYPRLRKCLLEELPNDLLLQDVKTETNYPVTFPKIRDKNSFIEETEGAELKEHGLFIDIFLMEKVPSKKWKEFIDYIYGHCFRAVHNFTDKKDKIISSFIYPISLVLLFLTRLINHFIPSSQIAHLYGSYTTNIYDKSLIFPIKDIVFEGITVCGPNQPHEVLRHVFGDYMQIPPKEKRPQHSTKIEIYQ